MFAAPFHPNCVGMIAYLYALAQRKNPLLALVVLLYRVSLRGSPTFHLFIVSSQPNLIFYSYQASSLLIACVFSVPAHPDMCVFSVPFPIEQHILPKITHSPKNLGASVRWTEPSDSTFRGRSPGTGSTTGASTSQSGRRRCGRGRTSIALSTRRWSRSAT